MKRYRWSRTCRVRSFGVYCTFLGKYNATQEACSRMAIGCTVCFGSVRVTPWQWFTSIVWKAKRWT